MRITLLASVSLLTLPLAASAFYLAQVALPQANAIQVEIEGFRNDRGQVFCALFSSPDGFPKESQKATARVVSRISGKKATCEFLGIMPGTYAVSAFHDENSNGKLDTNLLGIPREGVGVSNGAKGHRGPPKFAAAAFPFSGGKLSMKIKLNYL